MADYCREHDVQLLCYGALGGGLFSRKWLGIPDPGRPAFENVSLDKYYRIVVDFGGWALFQELLRVLDGIAAKHAVSIPTVASRYVLEQQAVAAIIQGARHARHIQENVRVFSFALDASDRAQIEAILSRSKGPTGDCYDLDRAENRDALENVATEYFDVEDGKLVSRKRAAVAVAEPYGHHLAH
jgi:aryl-alcohol dehydrogenase-like predicted oxidoreductase